MTLAYPLTRYQGTKDGKPIGSIIEAHTAQDALDEVAREAGYENYMDACIEGADWAEGVKVKRLAPRKDKHVTFRMTPAEHQKLKELALQSNMRLGEFLRTVVRRLLQPTAEADK